MYKTKKPEPVRDANILALLHYLLALLLNGTHVQLCTGDDCHCLNHEAFPFHKPPGYQEPWPPIALPPSPLYISPVHVRVLPSMSSNQFPCPEQHIFMSPRTHLGRKCQCFLTYPNFTMPPLCFVHLHPMGV